MESPHSRPKHARPEQTGRRGTGVFPFYLYSISLTFHLQSSRHFPYAFSEHFCSPLSCDGAGQLTVPVI